MAGYIYVGPGKNIILGPSVRGQVEDRICMEGRNQATNTVDRCSSIVKVQRLLHFFRMTF